MKRNDARASLRRVRAAGGTAMYDAVIEAFQMAQCGRNRKKAVVVISDGNDTNSRADVRSVRQKYYLGYPRALTGGSTFTKVTLARRSKSSCRSKPGSCTHRTCAIFVASWSARRLRLASSSRWTNRRGRCGREAASAGFYKSPWGEHPKLQILTVGELLDGKPIDMPPIRQTSATFERAPRAKSKGAKLQQLEFDGEV